MLMWLFCYSEELVRGNYLEDANKVFLRGAKGGLRATDEIYDLLIEEDCKVGDHSNALEIAYEMEAAGRMATTYHFNCLLSVQVRFYMIYLCAYQCTCLFVSFPLYWSRIKSLIFVLGVVLKWYCACKFVLKL